MASMTDRELLQLAQAAVPEHLRSLGRIAVRHDAPAVAGLAAVEPAGDATMTALAKRVGAKLGAEEPNSAEVEFPEQTALGMRTTVVHIRNGKVTHVLKRG